MLGLRAVPTPLRCIRKRHREAENDPVCLKRVNDAYRPAKRAKKVASACAQKKQPRVAISRNVDPEFVNDGDDPEFDNAVKTVLRIHSEILAELHKHVRLRDLDRRRSAESKMTKQYDQLWDSVMVLLPWVLNERMMKRRANLRSYNVGQLYGLKPSNTKKSLAQLLQHARGESKQGCARDALCAAFSTLASRSEMCWLEAYDREKPSRGWFAHSLLDPTAVFRVSLTSELQPRPVSLIITHQLPISAAFSTMDARGPFYDCTYNMCQKRGYEFAMQDITRAPPGVQESRLDPASLVAEPKLRKLLGTKTPVLLLSVYAALAPREHVRKHRLGDIIKAELLECLREAKKRGQAVVFQVGGDEPHVLAEKVYLQPHVKQFGLRIGYLRCRSSSWASWEREKPWKDRPLIGLQLP